MNEPLASFSWTEFKNSMNTVELETRVNDLVMFGCHMIIKMHIPFLNT